MQKPLVFELNEKQEHQPLLQGQPQSCGMRSGRVWLAPGKACSVHTTGDHEEQLVFLAGQGVARIEQSSLPVGRGKICYIPPHTEHSIANTGHEPMEYIYCVAPARSPQKAL